MTGEKDTHLSPWACSRCNPLECICPCHPGESPLRCQLFGHKFTASHSLLDPSPEVFDNCLRCGRRRVTEEEGAE